MSVSVCADVIQLRITLMQQLIALHRIHAPVGAGAAAATSTATIAGRRVGELNCFLVHYELLHLLEWLLFYYYF